MSAQKKGEPIDEPFADDDTAVQEEPKSYTQEDLDAIVSIIRRKGPQTARYIGDSLGMVYGTVTEALQTLADRCVIESRSENKHKLWHLIEAEQPQSAAVVEEAPSAPAEESAESEESPVSELRVDGASADATCRDQWGYGVHAAALLCPPMSEEEYQALKEDIRVNGLQEKIVFAGDYILDGRHRYRALRELGIPMLIENSTQWKGQGSPIAYVVSKNLYRRHLSASQRAILAAKSLPMLEEEAKQRSLANLRHHRVSQSQTLDPSNLTGRGDTREIASEAYQVATGYVSQAKRLIEVDPDLAGAVELGEIPLYKAIEINRERTVPETPEECREAIVSLLGKVNLLSDASIAAGTALDFDRLKGTLADLEGEGVIARIGKTYQLQARQPSVQVEETPPHPGGDGPTVLGALPGLEEEGRQARYGAHPEQEKEKDTLKYEPTHKRQGREGTTSPRSRSSSFFYCKDYAWDEAGQRLTFTLVRPAVKDRGLKQQETKGLAIAGKALRDLGFRLPGETKESEDPFGEDVLLKIDAPALDLSDDSDDDEKYVH